MALPLAVLVFINLMVLGGFVFLGVLRKRMERDLAELKERASEGTAQVVDYYRSKIPPAQVEEFGLAGAEDRKWIAYALFRIRMPGHSMERDELLGDVLKWVFYTLIVLGSLLLILGVIELMVGEFGVGAMFCLIALSGMITAVLMSELRRQSSVMREEREVLELVYAQSGGANGDVSVTGED